MSWTVTPYTILLSTRVASTAAIPPTSTPASSERDSLPDDHGAHPPATSAEGHADSHLVRPFGDEVGDHAVDPDRRQQEADAAKYGQQHGAEVELCACRCMTCCIVATLASGSAGSMRAIVAAQRGDQSGYRHGSAHHQRHGMLRSAASAGRRSRPAASCSSPLAWTSAMTPTTVRTPRMLPRSAPGADRSDRRCRTACGPALR